MNKTHSKKILIVNDELDICESLKLILSDYYDLILTDSGSQSLEIIANSKDIGLVLLGIKMLTVNGLEMLKTIKEKCQDLNIIIVTGYNKNVEAVSPASILGAAEYIAKPFRSDKILETVKKYLR